MTRRRILKATEVRIGDRVRTPGRDANPHEETECEGDIEVVLRRDGDLIEAIEVICPCGRRTEVECLYDALETVGDPGPSELVRES